MSIEYVTWKNLQRLKVEASGMDASHQYFLCNKNCGSHYFELSPEYKDAIENDKLVDMPLPQLGNRLNEDDFSDDNPCWGYVGYSWSISIDALFYELIPREV